MLLSRYTGSGRVPSSEEELRVVVLLMTTRASASLAMAILNFWIRLNARNQGMDPTPRTLTNCALLREKHEALHLRSTML